MSAFYCIRPSDFFIKIIQSDISPIIQEATIRKLKEPYIRLTEAELKEGIILCAENAQRLCKAAYVLLSAAYPSNDTKVAYNIWALAVEELGKAVTLKAAKKDGKEYNAMKWACGKAKNPHKSRFESGCAHIGISTNTKIGEEISVYSNPSTKLTTLENLDKEKVAVGAGATGRFYLLSRTPSGYPLSTNNDVLRESCLYVEWMKEERQWKSPIKRIDNENGVIAYSTLDSRELENYIQKLQEKCTLLLKELQL